MHSHIGRQKICSEQLRKNYLICFGHNILHKQSKITLKELEKPGGVVCPVSEELQRLGWPSSSVPEASSLFALAGARRWAGAGAALGKGQHKAGAPGTAPSPGNEGSASAAPQPHLCPLGHPVLKRDCEIQATLLNIPRSSIPQTSPVNIAILKDDFFKDLGRFKIKLRICTSISTSSYFQNIDKQRKGQLFSYQNLGELNANPAICWHYATFFSYFYVHPSLYPQTHSSISLQKKKTLAHLIKKRRNHAMPLNSAVK